MAGGIFNPVSNELILGAVGVGVWLNDEPVRVTNRTDLSGAIVLASRSETARGEWKRFENMGLDIRPTGSVAYKLGLVAAGLADATWTLVPKNEWDVAGGAALVAAAAQAAACSLDGVVLLTSVCKSANRSGPAESCRVLGFACRCRPAC